MAVVKMRMLLGCDHAIRRNTVPSSRAHSIGHVEYWALLKQCITQTTYLYLYLYLYLRMMGFVASALDAHI